MVNHTFFADETATWEDLQMEPPTWWSVERATWEAYDTDFPSLGSVHVGTSNTHSGALLIVEFDKLRDEYDPAHEYYTATPHWGRPPFSTEPE